MALKFNVGDEVVVNSNHSNMNGECGIINCIKGQFNCITVDEVDIWLKDSELDFKYSFSKDEVISSLNEIYNSHGEQYEYTILVKKITFPMSALQVKNKFGLVLLDQLLLSRSEEA